MSEATCPRCGEIVRGVAADEQLERERDALAADLEAAKKKLAREQARKRTYKDERDKLLSERVTLQRNVGDARQQAIVETRKTCAADLAAAQQTLEKAEGYAVALATYTEHRRACASQKWYPNLSRPECDCDLDSLRKDLDDSLAASVVEGKPDA